MSYGLRSKHSTEADELQSFTAEFEVSANDLHALTESDLSFLAKPPRYETLIPEYFALWTELVFRKERLATIDRFCDGITHGRDRYRSVSAATGVPWYVIGVIHALEASLDFGAHLHNGDPLSDYTVNEPKGRPNAHRPPFSWEESAVDALEFDRLTGIRFWPIERICYALELFNGFGYRLFHPEVKSPYLWSFSNHYERGKYIKDKVWSPIAVSKQCGAIVILKRMAERGLIEAPESETGRLSQLRSGLFSLSESPAARLVALAATRIGEAYDLGADVPLDDANWHGPWDCAEFASWLYFQTTGKVFGCVDNESAIKRLEPYSMAWYRDARAAERTLTIDQAGRRLGAFLVRKERPGKRGHVAISTGDGKTIEAKSAAEGVTRGDVWGRVWDIAVALV